MAQHCPEHCAEPEHRRVDAILLYCTGNVAQFTDLLHRDPWLMANSTCSKNEDDENRQVVCRHQRATQLSPKDDAQVASGLRKVTCSPT